MLNEGMYAINRLNNKIQHAQIYQNTIVFAIGLYYHTLCYRSVQ